MQPFVKAGRENPLGRHDVERLESGNPRQKIEVGGVQTVCIRDPVSDGDNDVADRIGRWLGHEPFTERVLVASARIAHPTLVLAKRPGQKPRLLPQALGGPIGVVQAERLVDQLLEPLHLLRLAAQMIVEAEHLGDQAGPELK